MDGAFINFCLSTIPENLNQYKALPLKLPEFNLIFQPRN